MKNLEQVDSSVTVLWSVTRAKNGLPEITKKGIALSPVPTMEIAMKKQVQKENFAAPVE